MTVRYFDYSPSIAQEITTADLIISHAGAGTALEVLRKNKPLICVINDELMDNHQTELAGELAARGHVYSATPGTLARVLGAAELGRLEPFPPADPGLFRNFVAAVVNS